MFDRNVARPWQPRFYGANAALVGSGRSSVSRVLSLNADGPHPLPANETAATGYIQSFG
jgi:hypothetical protein